MYFAKSCIIRTKSHVEHDPDDRIRAHVFTTAWRQPGTLQRSYHEIISVIRGCYKAEIDGELSLVSEGRRISSRPAQCVVR